MAWQQVVQMPDDRRSQSKCCRGRYQARANAVRVKQIRLDVNNAGAEAGE